MNINPCSSSDMSINSERNTSSVANSRASTGISSLNQAFSVLNGLYKIIFDNTPSVSTHDSSCLIAEKTVVSIIQEKVDEIIVDLKNYGILANPQDSHAEQKNLIALCDSVSNKITEFTYKESGLGGIYDTNIAVIFINQLPRVEAARFMLISKYFYKLFMPNFMVKYSSFKSILLKQLECRKAKEEQERIETELEVNKAIFTSYAFY